MTGAQKGQSWGFVTWGAALFFVLAVPVLLLTSNLRLAFNSLLLYTYGFERYQISQATGIPDAELRQAAREIIRYWNSDDELLDIKIRGRALYNAKEVIHLRDVKGLVQGVYLIQEATVAYLVAFVLGVLLLAEGTPWGLLARRARAGGAVTLGLLIVAGIALGAAFPWLFYLFHLVSFANDFWQLDPRTDYLVAMFPEGFWFIATMLVVVLTLAEAAALTVGGWLALRLLRRRSAQAPAVGGP
jgi:integral membrane protein (TIGR01906 family)